MNNPTPVQPAKLEANPTTVIQPSTTASPSSSNGMALPGPNVLLLGESGDGKTHSIRTLSQAGITPYVIFMEQGMETLGDMPAGTYHYRYIKPASSNWAQMLSVAKAVNQMSFDSLLKMTDGSKTQYAGFMDLITTMNQFKCDCCGKQWGDVAKWKTDRAVVFDGLTGLCTLAGQLYLGMKPAWSQSDWGVPQKQVLNLLRALTGDLQCLFVLISHLEREVNENAGGTVLTVKALGRALAPDIPPMFSDVIKCDRMGNKFSWSTAAGNCVTKSRNLPLLTGQEPSFVPLIEGWKKKGGKIEVTP
jgi:hypothetical protein